MAYGKLCTLFYDLDKPSAPAEEVAYFVGLAHQHPGLVIEPMCGSGRIMLPMAQAGITIEGFDLSRDMLDACFIKLSKSGLTVRAEEASFDSFKPSGQASMAFVALGSLGLLTREQDLKHALDKIHSWLKPGGVFAFDFDLTHQAESSSWPTGGRWLHTPEGRLLSIHWTGHYTHLDQVTHSILRYELIEDGKIIETNVELMEVKLFTPDQIKAVMLEAGFVDVKIDGFHGQEVNPETASTMTCLAYRP